MRAGEHRSAIVATRIYEPEGGAAAFRLAALVRALNAAGYRTTVLTSRVPERVPSTREVRRWPVLRDHAGAVRGYVQYASFDIPLFFRLMFSRRSDVVIVEPPPTTGVVCRMICRMRRIPYVYFSADVAATAAAGIGVSKTIVSVLRRVEGWVLRGARLVLAISDDVAREVVHLGAPATRVVTVGTGIDTRLFNPDGPHAASGYQYFVYAGTMSEIQGAGVFVEAFSRIATRYPGVRLIMLGQGVERARLEREATAAGPGRVEFPGTVSGERVAEWLRGACAGLASVRPERGYDFAYATKALVTLACGAPVIYAGVGPVANEVEDHDLGWAVGWDAAQVAEAMEAALADPITSADRLRLAQWATDNASLDRVAQTAVRAIDSALR
ncbi:MAG TPA: glycosyltransferase [Humibacter sp.]|nr:glycosyltransferase [Humibacter sp.]